MAGAVTASTLTTVAVFAPIALVGGFVGQLFAPFAITVTVALLASLLVSLTVVPVLAYWFLRPGRRRRRDRARSRRAAEAKELRSPLQRLPAGDPVRHRAALDHRAHRPGGPDRHVRAGHPAGDQLPRRQSAADTLSISQELPVGTSLAATDAAAKKVEAVLAAPDDVETYQVTVGNGGFNPFVGCGRRPHGHLSLTLRDGRRRQATSTTSSATRSAS